MIKEQDSVRIDKWLWSVRIFKTRTLAADHCRSRKVKINSKIVKPAQEVRVDDIIELQKGGFNLSFQALKLIGKRVSAPLAQTCYVDLTPEEEYKKYDDWFVGKAAPERRERGAGRPTKKERRQIDAYKEKNL